MWHNGRLCSETNCTTHWYMPSSMSISREWKTSGPATLKCISELDQHWSWPEQSQLIQIIHWLNNIEQYSVGEIWIQNFNHGWGGHCKTSYNDLNADKVPGTASNSTLIMIDLIHTSQSAPVLYPRMLHLEQKCAHFCSERSILGYRIDAFGDLWNWTFSIHLPETVILNAQLQWFISS